MNQSKSRLSAYEFACLFTAALCEQNTFVFDHDKLVAYIKKCQANQQYAPVLEHLTINENQCESLEQAFIQLKWEGVLYTFSFEPSTTIHIEEWFPSKKIMYGKPTYRTTMKTFATEYRQFEQQLPSHKNKSVARSSKRDPVLVKQKVK